MATPGRLHGSHQTILILRGQPSVAGTLLSLSVLVCREAVAAAPRSILQSRDGGCSFGPRSDV